MHYEIVANIGKEIVMDQLYSYTGYAYIFGKPINSKPIYLEVRAETSRKAKAKIQYRIKNWLSLSYRDRMEIDDSCVKAISEDQHVDMGHRKVIIAEGIF